MKRKVNLSKGVSARLVGGLIGGAGNAVYENYIEGMLPDSIQGYSKYVKAALGVALPMLVKGNQMINSLGDGLITCAANDIVSDLIGKDEDSNSSAEKTTVSGVIPAASRHMVSAARRPIFPKYVRHISGTNEQAARHMVTGTQSPVC